MNNFNKFTCEACHEPNQSGQNCVKCDIGICDPCIKLFTF